MNWGTDQVTKLGFCTKLVLSGLTGLSEILFLSVRIYNYYCSSEFFASCNYSAATILATGCPSLAHVASSGLFRPPPSFTGGLMSSSWSSPTTTLALKLQIQGDKAAARLSKISWNLILQRFIKFNLPALLNSPSLLTGWGCCFFAAPLAAPWLRHLALSPQRWSMPLGSVLRPSVA